MTKYISWTIAMIMLVFAALASAKAMSGQDKYSVKVPNGLAFSEFKGYEDWHVVSVSQAKSLGLIEVILGNPAMIAAYRSGFPGNGKTIPDGAMLAKIHWKAVDSTEAPGPTMIPGALDDVDFMLKDSKRFADTGGWGYGQFNYDPSSDTFSPLGDGAKCGFACHTIVAKKDYVFTAYGKR